MSSQKVKSERRGCPGLKRLRIKKGHTQESLARKIDVSTGQIIKVETGRANASIGLLDALKGELDCSYDDLLAPEDQAEVKAS